MNSFKLTPSAKMGGELKVLSLYFEQHHSPGRDTHKETAVTKDFFMMIQSH